MNKGGDSIRDLFVKIENVRAGIKKSDGFKAKYCGIGKLHH